MAAHHLPVVRVSGLTDVELLPTRGGPPHRIVFVSVESVSEARAILSVLRGKGVLRTPLGEYYPECDFLAAVDDDDEGAEGGWAAELRKGKHDAFDLPGVFSDSDFDSDDDQGGGGAHQDVVADGWVLQNWYPFYRAVDLGMLLEEVAGSIVPRLVRDPADPAALRRLRTSARAIRRVGKELPWLMGQAPVTLGNSLQNAAAKALARGTGAPAWMASRTDTILARVLDLHEVHRVQLALPVD